MFKIKTFFKKPAQVWQRIFGFLPVISLGGTALILGTFAIAPNFMNFAHAEEKVFAALENAAKGERHVAGLDARRGDLIDEGWKLVVVVFVD